MSEVFDWIELARKTNAPKDVVRAFLMNSGKDTVKHAAEALVAEDADYVSLNFKNHDPELFENWTGFRKGRQAFEDTFSNVGIYRDVSDFQITDIIGEGTAVAVFGSFTYTSIDVAFRFTSPFAIKAKVENGLITYFQFMEDTYVSARSCRKEGAWIIQNNGRTLEVGTWR